MTAIFHESDADLTVLSDRRIAVIGYGNLGRPIALNMRDSGLSLLVGNADDTYAHQARLERFEVMGLSEAAAAANVKILMLPDEVLPEIYIQHISPGLRP